ncbi:adenylate/guanylate cyclase domain-containing protein [[Leptolyngbya] sp. PCC 7376]|uniref:adenylate/guanylate cyclase domain-containing protein n=1 Tax=[Leptolyngbya] sp. PCC 7376 TaxID=111781 RepID=UPI0002F5586C|nr:adenylate/guanylate cyclase domain-containing protein [[Leptolyngbya] sp. PCC 7376]
MSSAKASSYVDDATALAVGADICDSFPELYGLEDIFAEILAGTQEQFEVKAINRQVADKQVYLDLYFRAYPTLKDTYSPQLLMFLEDVTDKMTLEQTLVQSNNETSLLVTALENARQYADTIIESIAEALIVTDPSGKILRINSVTTEILEYSSEELLGRSLFDVLKTPEAQLLRYEALSFFEQQTQGRSPRVEVNCLRKRGRPIILAFSCSRLDLANDQLEIIYVARDVTRDRLDQKRLAAQYMIARALSEVASIEKVIKDVLTIICNQLQFDVGELWQPVSLSEIDASNYPAIQSYPTSPIYLQRIHQVALANFDNKQVGFVDVSDRVLLVPGSGLAGRVWEQRSPQWIYDLVDDPDFGQKSFACREGLSSAFAFPVMAAGEILGIMTFFSEHPQSDNPELLQIMDAIGQQLGQYIRRKQTEEALKEQQQQTENLLLNILPESIATQLRQSGRTIARQFSAVTVLFADIVGFTEFSANLSPIEVVKILNQIFSGFDELTEKYKLEKIKTIGDSYMVVGGLPEPRPDHAAAIANMALDMQQTLTDLNEKTGHSFKLRIGINSGAVVAGVIGQKKFIYDLWGDTVNIASRMESHGVPDQIQCSLATYERLPQDNYQWEERGSIRVKGKGEMQTYFLVGRN